MTEIYWIGDRQRSQLAIVARPRGGEWLRDDLASLKAGGIDVLVSFLQPYEETELGLQDEKRLAGEVGLEFITFPTPDRQVPPDLRGFRRFVEKLAQRVREGDRLGVHCRGCIGRSTVLLAAVMITLGMRAEDALRQIERARGLNVPDTAEQLEWILNYQREA
jgi:protein-tyrosine phosphatase